ncbi:MAG: type II secretion system secretin GspD [Thermodesulfobacteriota bacterium]
MLIRQTNSTAPLVYKASLLLLLCFTISISSPASSGAKNLEPSAGGILDLIDGVHGEMPRVLLSQTTTTAGGEVPLPPHPFRQRKKITSPARTATPKPAKKTTTSSRAAPKRKPAKKIKKGMAKLNFSDARLKDVIMTISEITGRNFILSPEVIARKITIRTTKPIRKRDVSGIFETILAVNGLASVKTGDFYTIVIAKSAKQGNLKLYTVKDPMKIPRGAAMINLLVPVKFISAADIIGILTPTLSAGGNIAHYPKANTLIITDTASNVKKFLEIIEQLDVDLFEKLNVSLIHINHVDVETLATELHDIFSALGYSKDSDQFSAIPLVRFNSIIVLSSNKKLLGSAKDWIAELDKASSSDDITTHIYYVKNDKASNIQDILQEVYGKDKSETNDNKTPSSDFAAPVKKTAPRGNTKTKPAPLKVSATSESAPKAKGKASNLEIFIYEPTNAIIIRSSEREYQSLLSTIRELDRPPKQVLIDAIVVEVALDESLKYGIQWSALSGNVSTQSNTGIFSGTIDNPLSIISTPIGAATSAGLNLLVTDSKNFFGFLEALASDGKVNVLSNPHILVKNYAKASITVGSDEPIATQSTQTAVTTTASIIQSIEYRKTGIVLTVTPQITEAGMVAMTLHQEISDVSTSRDVGNGKFPSFTNREAETSVVIKDGQTIAIGGLIDTKTNKTHSEIPLISKIPLFGNLFKSTTISKDRTELVILLTPRVISNTLEAQKATYNLKSKLHTLDKYMDEEHINNLLKKE